MSYTGPVSGNGYKRKEDKQDMIVEKIHNLKRSFNFFSTTIFLRRVDMNLTILGTILENEFGTYFPQNLCS